VYDKFTAELRYPLSLNPSATFYLLSFIEGGYYWYDLQDFDPFRMYKSLGLGIRMFMPMFGMMGVDFGYGMDATNPQILPTIIIGTQF
jgi:outer membrane protein insertion porin family